MTAEPHGLDRGLTNYGDRDFARYLRRSFAGSMGISRELLNKPVVGIAQHSADDGDRATAVRHLVPVVPALSGSARPVPGNARRHTDPGGLHDPAAEPAGAKSLPHPQGVDH